MVPFVYTILMEVTSSVELAYMEFLFHLNLINLSFQQKQLLIILEILINEL